MMPSSEFLRRELRKRAIFSSIGTFASAALTLLLLAWAFDAMAKEPTLEERVQQLEQLCPALVRSKP